jgi:hypothetical protein
LQILQQRLEEGTWEARVQTTAAAGRGGCEKLLGWKKWAAMVAVCCAKAVVTHAFSALACNGLTAQMHKAMLLCLLPSSSAAQAWWVSSVLFLNPNAQVSRGTQLITHTAHILTFLFSISSAYNPLPLMFQYLAKKQAIWMSAPNFFFHNESVQVRIEKEMKTNPWLLG